MIRCAKPNTVLGGLLNWGSFSMIFACFLDIVQYPYTSVLLNNSSLNC